MGLLSRLVTPPPGYGPVRLGGSAVLAFAVAAVTLPPTLDRDHGLPESSTLREARGRVGAISKSRNIVRFSLHNQASTFAYRSQGGNLGGVESALASAGHADVTLLFKPDPAISPDDPEAEYDVWQLAVSDKPVRSAADIRSSWRFNNMLAAVLFVFAVLFGICLTVAAWRVARRRPFS